MKGSNLILHRILSVPIYGALVRMYVSKNAAITFRKVARARKLLCDDGAFMARSGSDGDNGFYLFFQKDDLTENAIAHEVRHCADQILDHIGHFNCTKCSNEPFAYLIGYIQNWIKLEIRRAGITVLVDCRYRARNRKFDKRPKRK